MLTHTILGGEVQLYQRPDSPFWQCYTHYKNRAYRKSTKEESLSLAKQIAEDWYLELRGKARAGLLTVAAPAKVAKAAGREVELPAGLKRRITFNEAADKFNAAVGEMLG